MRQLNFYVCRRAKLLAHDVKQLVQVALLKVFPPVMSELRLELVFVHSVRKLAKDTVTKVLNHARVSRFILLHLVKVDLVVDAHRRLADHLLNHFLDDGCRAYHEVQCKAQVFVSNYKLALLFRTDDAIKHSRLVLHVPFALDQSK